MGEISRDSKDLVVLVVANSRDDTDGLVDVLKRSLIINGDWVCNTPAEDVSSHHCGCRRIVDTIPMRNMVGRSDVGLARRWISRNCLRRIVFGRKVIVVCVLLCRLVNSKGVFSPECEEWMELFGLIFKPLREAVIILAKEEDEIDAKKRKRKMRNIDNRRSVGVFVEKHGLSRENIVFTNGQNWNQFRVAIEHGNISRREEMRGAIEYGIFPEDIKTTIVPYFMFSEITEEKIKVIWGSEKVIVFGKAGSGKSTLAQMLTLGKLDPSNKKFVPGAGPKGATERITKGDDRGWSVLDTPGFGETKDGTIPSVEVFKTIKHYVESVDGTFAHFLFVVKAGRLDGWDQKTWFFVNELLGGDVKHNLSIVVSGADGEWVEDNRQHFRETFKGCDHIFGADFSADSPISPDLSDEQQIKIQRKNRARQETRDETLSELEMFLAGRKLTDRHCPRHIGSKAHIRNQRNVAELDAIVNRSETSKFLESSSYYLHQAHDFASRIKAKLTEPFRRSDPPDIEAV